MPDPTELIERLHGMETYGYQSQLACQAADAIKALQAEIARLGRELEAARLSERARIVAFLRKHPGDHARVFAKAVEDGEHTPIG